MREDPLGCLPIFLGPLLYSTELLTYLARYGLLGYCFEGHIVSALLLAYTVALLLCLSHSRLYL